MTPTIDAALQIQRQSLKPEPVGSEWLEDFRQRFSDEFPEDIQAQQAVEAQGERPAKQGRF
jgi:hypothetical protein